MAIRLFTIACYERRVNGAAVLAVGFEPTWARAQRIAVPLRLPISPRQHLISGEPWQAQGLRRPVRHPLLCRTVILCAAGPNGITESVRAGAIDCGGWQPALGGNILGNRV